MLVIRKMMRRRMIRNLENPAIPRNPAIFRAAIPHDFLQQLTENGIDVGCPDINDSEYKKRDSPGALELQKHLGKVNVSEHLTVK